MVALTIDVYARTRPSPSARTALPRTVDHPQISILEVRNLHFVRSGAIIGVETAPSLLYTTSALCVSPNALCSISFSTSCSQSHVLSVTLKFRSADGEGHVRNAGRPS